MLVFSIGEGLVQEPGSSCLFSWNTARHTDPPQPPPCKPPAEHLRLRGRAFSTPPAPPPLPLLASVLPVPAVHRPAAVLPGSGQPDDRGDAADGPFLPVQPLGHDGAAHHHFPHLADHARCVACTVEGWAFKRGCVAVASLAGAEFAWPSSEESPTPGCFFSFEKTKRGPTSTQPSWLR